MRILVLGSEPPWPLCYGGRLHAYELCRRLALRHELLFVAPQPCEAGAPDFNFVYRAADRGRLHHDGRTPETPESIARIDRFFGIDSAYTADAVRLAREWQPDVVVGMNYRALAWLARIQSTPTICDLLDDPILHGWRELRTAGVARLWTQLKTLAATSLFERRYLKQVSAITVVADADARWCRRQSRGTPVVCIPHGVDSAYFAPLDPPENDNEIIFWGGLTFRPNIRALLFFADRVWPLLRARRPDLRWNIVGWGRPRELERLRGAPGLHFTGRVDDIRPHVARAAVAVVPMLSGAGIKNKIMEAWAMARPVVCTPMALGSLPGRHGHDVWTARSPRKLAEGVITLLDDASLRRRIGRAARETALLHCSWDTAAARLETLCAELAGQHQPPAAAKAHGLCMREQTAPASGAKCGEAICHATA